MARFLWTPEAIKAVEARTKEKGENIAQATKHFGYSYGAFMQARSKFRKSKAKPKRRANFGLKKSPRPLEIALQEPQAQNQDTKKVAIILMEQSQINSLLSTLWSRS